MAVRLPLLLVLVVGCGAPPEPPMVTFTATNRGPRALVEFGGSLGRSEINGTALLGDGESVTTTPRQAQVNDEVRLTVTFGGAAFQAPARVVPLEGLEIRATRTDTGCDFAFGP